MRLDSTQPTDGAAIPHAKVFLLKKIYESKCLLNERQKDTSSPDYAQKYARSLKLLKDQEALYQSLFE